MQEIMEREERNKLLNYLNEHSYPFRDYKFVQDYNGNMKRKRLIIRCLNN